MGMKMLVSKKILGLTSAGSGAPIKWVLHQAGPARFEFPATCNILQNMKKT